MRWLLLFYLLCISKKERKKGESEGVRECDRKWKGQLRLTVSIEGEKNSIRFVSNQQFNLRHAHTHTHILSHAKSPK